MRICRTGIQELSVSRKVLDCRLEFRKGASPFRAFELARKCFDSPRQKSGEVEVGDLQVCVSSTQPFRWHPGEQQIDTTRHSTCYRL